MLISGTWKGQEVELANSIRLNVGQLLYSGILISSLGAVMDVSVSVAAAIEEIHEKAPAPGRPMSPRFCWAASSVPAIT